MDKSLSNVSTTFISRRDFLKLGGISLASLLLPQFSSLNSNRFQELNPAQQGRVVQNSVSVYDIPSFSGNELKIYWKDTILPITEITVGDETPAYNRIWYHIGKEGFVHSGVLQPVRTVLNQANNDIPTFGRLAEVTVPYTDAYWGAGKGFDVAYRYYYATTYWVTGLTKDANGEPWYQVMEDKWDFIQYVQAAHMRLVPDDELTPISIDVPLPAKRIEINTDDQVLVAYEWERPIFMARIASGAKFSTGNYSTPTGHHIINHKRPSRHMAAGNLAFNGYDLPGVPWVSYFTESGISIHGTYWHNDFGKPRSHGCVNLSPQAAKWVFRWTLPYVPPYEQRVYEDYGTSVDVISKEET